RLFDLWVLGGVRSLRSLVVRALRALLYGLRPLVRSLRSLLYEEEGSGRGEHPTTANAVSVPMADFDVRAAALTEEAEALLGRLLRRGGDYADVYYEQTIRHRHGLRQRAGRGCLPAATAQREVVEGAGLRVLAAAAEGFAWTGALEPEALAAAADRAADRAVESLDA